MTELDIPSDSAGDSDTIDFFRDENQAVVFLLDSTEFAIDIASVDEVVRVPQITPVPFSPPDVLGVVGIRGAILPVLDLGARILGKRSDPDGRLLIVTVAETQETVALVVDEVTKLIGMAEAVEDIPPEIEQSLPPGWIRAVLSQDDRMVTLLEIDAVLANERAEENAQ